MNAQNGLMVVLGLGALAGIGYAVASSGKSSDIPDGGSPPPPDTGPLPSYVTQELVNAYQQCYQFGCSQAEYDQIRAGLQELIIIHPEETPLWVYFQDELAKQQVIHNASASSSSYSDQSAGLGINFGAQNTAPMSSQSAEPLDLGALGGQAGLPLSLPLNFPATLAVSYINCWYQLCPQTEFDTLTSGMIAYMNRSDTNDANRAQVSLALKSAYARRQFIWQSTHGTQGITGRHTGGCACQARQEEVGTGACCDSCAEGKECEECGNHAPAVG